MSNNEVDNTINKEERKLGNEKMGKLFRSYLFAVLIGYTLQMTTVVADGIFVGSGVGAMGFAAIAIVSPFWTLLIGLGMLFAVGGSSLAGMYLGEGKDEEARKVFGQTFWYGMILTVIITILVLLNLENILTFMGANDPVVLKGATEYMNLFMPFFPFMVMGSMLFFFVRLDEKPLIGTLAYSLPVPICIIAEWLIIMKYDMGVVGSAAGYVICVTGPFLILLYFLFSKKTKFKIKFSDLKLDFNILKEVHKIGFAAFIMQISVTVFGIVINILLAKYGNSMDIAAFGLINGYVLYVLINISNGFVATVQPISSYNIGAKLYSRVIDAIMLGMKSIVVTMAVILVIVIVFANQILGYFAAGDMELVDVTKNAILLFLILYPIGGITLITSGYFQAIGDNKKAILNGIGRILLFAVPLAYIMSSIMGVNGIWLSFTVSEAIAAVLAIYFIRKEIKRLKQLNGEIK